MRDLYNVEVPPIKNYFPFLRDWTLYESDLETPKLRFNKGGELGIEQLSLWPTLEQDYVPRNTAQTAKGFTVERKQNASGALRIDAAEILDDHLNKVAHMLAHQRDLKMMGEVVRSDEFAEKYGKNAQKYVLDFLDSIARDADPAGAVKNKVLDGLRRNTTIGIQFLRVASHVKHVANLPYALYFVKPEHLISAAYDSFTEAGRRFIAEYFQEVNQRAGGETELAELGSKSFWDKAQRYGFIIEKGIDQALARASVLGAYKQELAAKGLDYRNYDQIPVDKQAQAKALRIARQIVTSPLRKDVPQVLSRGFGGKQTSYARAVFQFQTTMLRQWSFINQEIYQKGIKEMDPYKAALATMVVLSSIAAETTASRGVKKLMGSEHQSNGSKKDGDEFLKDYSAELFRRVPFAGNMTAAYLYGESGIPTLDTAIGAFKSLKAKKSTGKFQETAAQTILPLLATEAGYPELSKVIPMVSPLLRGMRNIDTRYYEAK
jgi:hypothetical protein